MTLLFDATRAFAKNVLENPHRYDWTLQGFGMLRTHLSDEWRLHVWSPEHAVPGVSEIHTHPWDFNSLVVSGHVWDSRYAERYRGDYLQRHNRTRVLCGENGGPVSACEDVYLRTVDSTSSHYNTGSSYQLKHDEIHRSEMAPGTVTLIRRTFCQEDVDHAYVYHKGDFVSAEPRPAMYSEVQAITQRALQEWKE